MAFPELQVITLGIRDLPAGGGDNRVSRRDIPFAATAEAEVLRAEVAASASFMCFLHGES